MTWVLFQQLDSKRLSAVLKQAHKQANEEDSDDDAHDVLDKLNLGRKPLYEDDFESEGEGEELEYDPKEFQVDQKDEHDFDRFLKLSGEKTIYDLIQEKLEQRKNANMMPVGGVGFKSLLLFTHHPF